MDINKKKNPGNAEGGEKVQAVIHKMFPPHCLREKAPPDRRGSLPRMISILHNVFNFLQVHFCLLQSDSAHEQEKEEQTKSDESKYQGLLHGC